MQVEYTPMCVPASFVMDFMPELKHESPIPWATTIGRPPLGTRLDSTRLGEAGGAGGGLASQVGVWHPAGQQNLAVGSSKHCEVGIWTPFWQHMPHPWQEPWHSGSGVSGCMIVCTEKAASSSASAAGSRSERSTSSASRGAIEESSFSVAPSTKRAETPTARVDMRDRAEGKLCYM